MSLFPCHLNMRAQEFGVIMGSGLLFIMGRIAHETADLSCHLKGFPECFKPRNPE